MKTKKLSFSDIKKVLSKKEMKNIMAGSNGCGSCVTGQCFIDTNEGKGCLCPAYGNICTS